MGKTLKTAYQAAQARGRKEDRVLFGMVSIGQSQPQDWTAFQSAAMPGARQTDAEFSLCRKLAEENVFLQTLLDLKLSFGNYDLKVMPAETLDEAGKKAFKEWWEAVATKARKHVRDIWRDYLRYNNAVSWWNDDIGKGVGALALDLARCQYSDRLGLETLKYRHELTQADKAKLPEAERKKYETPQVELEQNGEKTGWRVLREAKAGEGFGRPAMASVFKSGSIMESMEVGEMLMGFYNRTIVRFHRLGYEVKGTGVYAGTSRQHWKKARWDEIQAFFKKNQGAVEASGNFDHKIEFIHPPVEYFNDKKWEGLQRRFVWWAGPVGWMLLSKTISPFLMDLLRSQIKQDRELVGDHLSMVLGEAYNAPCKIKVKWGLKCFRDMRLAMDMIKWAVQQGPLSTRTAIEEMDYEWSEEQERKRVEAKLPAELIEPRFDQNHTKGDKGKPRGTKDVT